MNALLQRRDERMCPSRTLYPISGQQDSVCVAGKGWTLDGGGIASVASSSFCDEQEDVVACKWCNHMCRSDRSGGSGLRRTEQW